MRHLAVLIGIANDAEGQARVETFRKGMKELGWMRNATYTLMFVSPGGIAERARTYAAELVAMAPDVMLGNTAPVVSALQQQTRSIPQWFLRRSW